MSAKTNTVGPPGLFPPGLTPAAANAFWAARGWEGHRPPPPPLPFPPPPPPTHPCDIPPPPPITEDVLIALLLEHNNEAWWLPAGQRPPTRYEVFTEPDPVVGRELADARSRAGLY
ncbi:hypothetical protein ACEQ8H_001615 [Pleosporales sp. CAS-2024a]